MNASTWSNVFCITSGSVGHRGFGAVPHGEEVLRHGHGPFGGPTYAGEGRCWFRETVETAQSDRREARAGITIAAATTWVRASVNFVAVWASASTSGTIDSAVSAIVVTRNVCCGRVGPAREDHREDRADERTDEGQLREPEERDRLAADLDRHVEARRARRDRERRGRRDQARDHARFPKPVATARYVRPRRKASSERSECAR